MFGEGADDAALVLVGEPGDAEDRARSPFVGPAVTRDRGAVVQSRLGVPALATAHPSAVLRSRDEERRREALAGLVDDLRVAARQVAQH